MWSKKASLLLVVAYSLVMVFWWTIPQRVELFCVTTLLFFYLATIEESNHPKKRLLIASAIVLAIFFFFVLPPHSKDRHIWAHIFLFFIAGLFFHKNFLGKSDRISWEWQNSAIRTLLEAMVVGAIFFAALELLFHLTKFVLDTEIPPDVRSTAYRLGFWLAPTLIYLTRISLPRPHLSKFGQGILNFAATPLWAIYVFFLNIYAIRILVQWSLPKGMVVLPVSIAFAIYSVKWWGSMASPATPATRRTFSILERSIRWMHVTLIVLFWISVGRRLADYGFTQPRYFLILLGLFFSGVVFFDLKGRLDGKSYAALLLLAIGLGFIHVA